ASAAHGIATRPPEDSVEQVHQQAATVGQGRRQAEITVGHKQMERPGGIGPQRRVRMQVRMRHGNAYGCDCDCDCDCGCGCGCGCGYGCGRGRGCSDSYSCGVVADAEQAQRVDCRVAQR